MGSVHGALRVLRQLKDVGPEIVVSGHGPEVLDNNINYLQWLQELALDGLSAGRGPLETALRAPGR